MTRKKFEQTILDELRAIRAEMAHDRAETAKEFATIRGEIANEFAAIRAEMVHDREETAKEFAAIRAEMAGDRQQTAKGFAAVRSEAQAFREDVRDQMRSLHNAIGEVRADVAELKKEFQVFKKLLIDLGDRVVKLENQGQHMNLEIRELRVEISDRMIVRIDDHEGRIYKLEKR